MGREPAGIEANPTGRIRIEQRPEMTVIGPWVRTSNAAEAGGRGSIGPLWDRVMRDGFLRAVPDAIGASPVAVMTDYAGGAGGDYTYTVGLVVSSSEHVPASMHAVLIPAGRYAIIESEAGPPSETVPRAWSRIWRMSADELGGERSFRADYEYYTGPTDPVAICVGLK